MILFTKNMCHGCEMLKEQYPLTAMGVQVCVVDEYDGLAELAWNELVAVAEVHGFPILFGTKPITDYGEIKKVLDDLYQRMTL